MEKGEALNSHTKYRRQCRALNRYGGQCDFDAGHKGYHSTTDAPAALMRGSTDPAVRKDGWTGLPGGEHYVWWDNE